MFRQTTIKGVLTYSILGLILLCLLAINIYLFLYDENIGLSFTDMFTKIQEMPRIDSTFIKLGFETGIISDWGVFNFARDFVNGLWQIIGLALYVCVQVVNVMIYVFQLIRTLFIGVLG